MTNFVQQCSPAFLARLKKLGRFGIKPDVSSQFFIGLPRNKGVALRLGLLACPETKLPIVGLGVRHLLKPQTCLRAQFAQDGSHGLLVISLRRCKA